jgi:glycosyltransferase involved in cell wall biosynthesis
MSVQSKAAAACDGVSARLLVDASTLIRWWGPPVGIVRVEAELIRHVLDREPAAVLCVFDTRSNQFRPLDRKIARLLVDGRAVVETSLMPDPRAIKRTPLRAAFTAIERKLRPLLRFRRILVCALDEWSQRLPAAARPMGAAVVDRLLSRRLRARVTDKDGRRRSLFRLDSALGRPVPLGRRDIILSAGADWGNKDPAAIAALKSRTGFRLVMLCHDLIPVLFPHFYQPRDVAVFADYLRAALGFVDRFICVSQRTADDLARFAAAHGCRDIDIRTARLGADAARSTAGTPHPLARGLLTGRYVLLVSTIEPRKNHAFILRVWRRLAAGAYGGTAGFKLVFAGRLGWMTQDIVAALSRDTVLKRDVVHIASASDGELDTLYAHAAFTVYPSCYEGFGLPVIESFMHGKPVIASAAGSVPEAAAGLALCIDPADEDGWAAAMGRWINDPACLAEQARRVGAEFSWPSWAEAAAGILTIVR